MKKLLLTLIVLSSSFLSYSYTIAYSGGVFYELAFPVPIVRAAPDLTDGANDFVVYDGVCVLTSDAVVKSLGFSGGALTISGSSTLTVNENATINSGNTITINSGATLSVTNTVSNSGTVIVNSGGNLIQTSTGSATGTGYQVSVPGSANVNNYNYWSSPITSAGLSSTFSGANECDMYYLNAASQTWTRDVGSSTCEPVAPASGDGNMDIGRGYSIAGGGSSTFSGQVNNGTITEGITAGGTSADWSGSGWNLIGNPYPSSIDGTSFLGSNGAGVITGTLYFWSDDGSGGGSYDENNDYASWNTGGGTGASGGGSSTVPNGSIAVGQGFIVQANSTTNVIFSNSMRGGENSQFFKTEKEEIARVWVSATEQGHFSSQILIAFSENATENEDWSYDAVKLSNGQRFLFGSILGNNSDPYAIQSFAKSDLETSREVPLSIITEKAGITSFQIDGFENWDSSMVVSIKDKVTGKIQNLDHGPYSTYLNANEKYDSRFTLLINNPNGPPTSVNDVDPSKLKLFFNEGNLTIANTVKMKTIDIFSISGVKVNSHSLNESTYSQISLNELPTGIYIGSVTLENGNTISKIFAVQ